MKTLEEKKNAAFEKAYPIDGPEYVGGLWDVFTAGWDAAQEDAADMWISVEDELPEKGVCVLCLVGGYVVEGQYNETWATEIDPERSGYSSVTHWQSLPKMPNE